MTIPNIGQTVTASTTVSASPAPTDTVFTVASIIDFAPGMTVLVDGTDQEDIQNITGNVITLANALPFTPTAGMTVENFSAPVTNDYINLIVDEVNTLSLTLGVTADPRFGTGMHGYGALGALAAPSATITAVAGVTGLITGTVRYRVTFFNLSGETVATADPGADTSVTAKKVTVGAIPVSGDAACQGRAVYRSMDAGSTWHQVGKIYNNVDTSWTDNNPYTGGASVPGGDTTGNTGTLPGGEWHFTNFDIATGQTLTLDSAGSQGGIGIIRATGATSIVGTLTATGTFLRNGYPQFYSEVATGGRKYQLGVNGIDGGQNTDERYGPSVIGAFAIGQTKAAYGATGWRDALYKIGCGGADGTGAGRGYAGATLLIFSKGAFSLTGTINNKGGVGSNGTSNSPGGGGGGGGIVVIYSDDSIITSSGTIDVSGGVGGNAASGGGGSNASGGGGGGGGFIVKIAPIVSTAGTETLSGGTGGNRVTNATGTMWGGSGGMSAGEAGNGNPGNATGESGGTGQSITFREKGMALVA